MTLGNNDKYAPPIYHRFIDEVYKVSDRVELVHPARFLFNAGSTPKAWNQKMLADEHLKILWHEQNSKAVFPNVQEITGGIVITYHDMKQNFGAIGVYTVFDELNCIKRKVAESPNFRSFESMVYSAYSFHMTEQLYVEHPELKGRMSDGHDYDLKTNVFSSLPEVFTDSRMSDTDILIYGRKNNGRYEMWTKREYIDGPDNISSYKLLLSGADGAAGTIGKPIPARVIGVPIVAPPNSGTTESLLSVGAFTTENEAENASKYMKTKFFRTLLSVLKVTQNITPGKFKYVPLQDFTPSSDIDWTQSIHDIDLQLYRKYGLDAREIDFIESHVKEMA